MELLSTVLYTCRHPWNVMLLRDQGEVETGRGLFERRHEHPS